MQSLYQISFLVRNQGTRHLALTKAQSYEPEDPEGAALLQSFIPLDRQHVDDFFREPRRQPVSNDHSGGTRVDYRPEVLLEDRLIKSRCLEATIIRRRQLAYRKSHGRKLRSAAILPDTSDCYHQIAQKRPSCQASRDPSKIHLLQERLLHQALRASNERFPERMAERGRLVGHKRNGKRG